MVKLLYDMNVSPLWSRFFASNNIYGVRWLKIGMESSPDIEIMEYARENGFVIFTYDTDFGTLLAKYGYKLPSVIQIRTQSACPESHGGMILMFLNEQEQKFNDGILVSIMNNSYRVKSLPIIFPRFKM